MTKSITSKHQFFFFNRKHKVRLVDCDRMDKCNRFINHQLLNLSCVCVCVWGCVSVCAWKNFMYVWSENDILLCATHLCQTCLTGPLWHCALYTLIITTYRHNFSPLSMFHSENLHTCSSIFSSSCAEFINIRSLRSITVSGIRTCYYSGIYT